MNKICTLFIAVHAGLPWFFREKPGNNPAYV